MWQRQDDGTTRTWADAGTYCSGLSLGGHSDWRLPEAYELPKIMNFGTYNPIIDQTYFPSTKNQKYWSTTTFANSPSTIAWQVKFSNGDMGGEAMTESNYVRCVRGTRTTRSFTDNGDSTVTDTKTRLVWQQTPGSQRNWTSSLTYCEDLTLGSLSDWRLPNIKELGSIVDLSVRLPSIDGTAFPNSGEGGYWSSTTRTDEGSYASFVDFSNGGQDTEGKTSSNSVRCVRGGQ
jgi:hypothetical protein